MKKGRDYIGVGVGAVIINDNEEILLLLRKKSPESGRWTIPGGSVEFGERVEDAIIREVNEELGIDVEVIKLLRVTNHIVKEEGQHWISPAFLVKHVSGTPVNKEPESHSEINWFSIHSLPDNVTITTSLALKSYLELDNTEN